MPTVFAVSGRRRARCFSTPVTMIFTALITGGYLAHARDQVRRLLHCPAPESTKFFLLPRCHFLD